MIRPTAEELLAGMAASLKEEVLPHMAPGTPRIQVEMAITILRRLSVAVPLTGPYFRADNADIEATLRELRPGTEAVLPEIDPGDVPALAARNRELHERLAALVPLLASEPPPAGADRGRAETTLRGLFRRMVDRELELAPGSPYG